ncbi:hypothetical protein OI25_3402 [Paraburkholderia fungorum]|uniref:Uncharacterized protein n=1 Tax=Paraburkholderia fungorum TaxID=134537 RepID=A0AAU8T2R8_9BURK|nr:hypothetical protein [Paraburkholderia fungorum]AJZ60570.1 hypothetical protein OI25_3402 [Paraburkholderia fungorum]
MNNTARRGDIAVVDFEQHADMLEKSRVVSRVDVGSTLIYKVIHPEQGELILVATTSERAAQIML